MNDESVEFDEKKFYLGKMCKGGHDYLKLQKSLRYSSSRCCVLCLKEKDKERDYKIDYLKNREHRLKYGKKYRFENRENIRKYKLKNKEHYQKYHNKYCKDKLQNDIDFRLKALDRTRARRLKIKTNRIIYIGNDWLSTLNYFNNSCAYCNVLQDQLDYKLHIEHVVPIASNGIDSIYNVVPACRNCNYSKSDKPLLSWLLQSGNFTVEKYLNIYKCLVNNGLEIIL